MQQKTGIQKFGGVHLLTQPIPHKSLKEHQYLACTPAYDPNANRIEWLWRVSQRVVTHNHQRSDFDLLLADVETLFQALTQTPADVLRHTGSPFAPDTSRVRSQADAA